MEKQTSRLTLPFIGEYLFNLFEDRQTICEEIAELQKSINLGSADDNITMDTLQANLKNINDQIKADVSDFKDKIDTYAYTIKAFDRNAENCELEAERLLKRAKRFRGMANNCKYTLSSQMQLVNQEKIKTEKFTFSHRKSESVQVDIDEKALPVEFKREKITHSADKKAIKEAIASGKKITGCSIVKKKSLQIR